MSTRAAISKLLNPEITLKEFSDRGEEDEY